ncbi:tape measure protein [Deinococcus navajonensis]|uniref:Tape measure protein n=1 Tax=Deinococcus navajonensis TaxID=309884 RepID=A0ABV8XMY6_9DEIO
MTQPSDGQVDQLYVDVLARQDERTWSDLERQAQQAGERSGGAFGGGFKRNAAGRLVDEKGRFVKEGEDVGEAAGRAAGRRFSNAFGNEAQASSQKLAGILAGVATAAGGAASGLIQLAGQAEQSQVAFTTLLGSAEKARKFLADLSTFAANTPFELTGLQESSKKLLAFGFSAQQIIPMMTAIGDAVGSLGGGADVLDGVVTALGQIQAKGKVSAEEMAQIAERGIPAWKFLADQMGISVPEAMKKAQDGAISAAQAIPAILKGMQDKFGGGMEAQSRTLLGMWSTTMDNLKQAGVRAGNQLVEALDLKTRLTGFNEWVARVPDMLAKLDLKKWAADNSVALTAVSGALIGALIPALVAGGAAAVAFITPLLPFIATGAAITLAFKALGVSFQDVTRVFKDLVQGDWSKAWTDLKDIAQRALENLGPALERGWAKIKDLGTKLGRYLTEGLKGSLDQIQAVILTALGDAISRMARDLPALIRPAFEAAARSAYGAAARNAAEAQAHRESAGAAFGPMIGPQVGGTAENPTVVVTGKDLVTLLGMAGRTVLNAYGVSGKDYHHDGAVSANATHNGIDYGAPRGSAILAPFSGMVTFRSDARNGNIFDLVDAEGQRLTGIHLNSFNKEIQAALAAGAKSVFVEQGTRLGTVGNTGTTAGSYPHLHLMAYLPDGTIVDATKVKFVSLSEAARAQGQVTPTASTPSIDSVFGGGARTPTTSEDGPITAEQIRRAQELLRALKEAEESRKPARIDAATQAMNTWSKASEGNARALDAVRRSQADLNKASGEYVASQRDLATYGNQALRLIKDQEAAQKSGNAERIRSANAALTAFQEQGKAQAAVVQIEQAAYTSRKATAERAAQDAKTAAEKTRDASVAVAGEMATSLAQLIADLGDESLTKTQRIQDASVAAAGETAVSMASLVADLGQDLLKKNEEIQDASVAAAGGAAVLLASIVAEQGEEVVTAISDMTAAGQRLNKTLQERANLAAAEAARGEQEAYLFRIQDALADIQNLSEEGLVRLYDEAYAMGDQQRLKLVFDEFDRRARASKEYAQELKDVLTTLLDGTDLEMLDNPLDNRDAFPNRTSQTLTALIGDPAAFAAAWRATGSSDVLPELLVSQFKPEDFAGLGTVTIQGLLDNLGNNPAWAQVTAVLRTALGLAFEQAAADAEMASLLVQRGDLPPGVFTGNERPQEAGDPYAPAPDSLASREAARLALEAYATSLRTVSNEELAQARAFAIAANSQDLLNVVTAEGTRRMNEAEKAVARAGAALAKLAERQAFLATLEPVQIYQDPSLGSQLNTAYGRGQDAGNAAGIGSLLGVAEGFGKLLTPMNLFAQILDKINPVATILEGVFSVLAEPIKAIQEPLKIVGRLVGSLIAPLLELMAPILRVVVDVLVAVYDTLASLIKTVTFGLVNIDRRTANVPGGSTSSPVAAAPAFKPNNLVNIPTSQVTIAATSEFVAIFGGHVDRFGQAVERFATDGVRISTMPPPTGGNTGTPPVTPLALLTP